MPEWEFDLLDAIDTDPPPCDCEQCRADRAERRRYASQPSNRYASQPSYTEDYQEEYDRIERERVERRERRAREIEEEQARYLAERSRPRSPREWEGVYRAAAPISTRCYDCGRIECSCYDADDDYGNGIIHDHSYKPTPRFLGRGPRYMGFELETAVQQYTPLGDYYDGDREAELVQGDIGDIGYLKEDGSISNGFEIVTHPMSYKWAMRNFPWAAMDEWKHHGIRPDETTGLHVHVSREAFKSPSHVYRWMKLFYRNRDQIERIARRRSNSWARFDVDHRDSVIAHALDKLEFFDRRGRAGRSGVMRAANRDRYTAINVQNEKTFEVRIFNSTDSAQELQAALGLIDSTVEYTQQLTANDVLASDGWQWEAFTRWVNEQDYAPLSREMRKLCV